MRYNLYENYMINLYEKTFRNSNKLIALKRDYLKCLKPTMHGFGA